VESPYGDPHFGEWSAEENAEYVVKLHVLAAAAGLERDHWSLVSNPDTAYWNGPWTVMGLMTSERQRRPAFYAFQIMLETLNGFEGVEDLGFDGLRLFRFLVAGEPVYVAWSSDEDPVTYDLSGSLEEASLSLTPIVTELASDGSPHWPEVLTVEPTAIPLSMTPVFLE
jgi:hypothetical protein